MYCAGCHSNVRKNVDEFSKYFVKGHDNCKDCIKKRQDADRLESASTIIVDD